MVLLFVLILCFCCFFYTTPHDSGGVLWFHARSLCVCPSNCPSVVHPFVLFPDDNLSKHQWIFTKLGMCIDIVDIWFGIANGQISSIFYRVICPRQMVGYYSLTFLFSVTLFCLAAVIFPIGFAIDEIGGQPYKLPNQTQVGSSYVLFILAIFFTVISELFAGKVCLPMF